MTDVRRRRGSLVDALRSDERLLVLPAALTLLVFFVVPLAMLVGISFSGDTPLAAYRKFFGSAAAMKILANTVTIAAVVTLVCAVVAVPFSLALSRLPPAYARLALLGVTLPMWISLLVRTYAWLYVLAQEGVTNAALEAVGMPGAPFPLLFNWGSVTVGMVHILLPYMLLPVHNAVTMLDPQLMRAARSLGAGSLRIFATVILPLIARGIATGAILVFILSLGFFVTPQMLGGPRNTMIATYIDVMTNTTLDWPRAAAASTVLVLGVLVCFAILSVLSRKQPQAAP
ncbi:MAG: ABC transporter permease [Rhizobiaceae bacterium]|nr:ABC transporter permease [Rhizobiaceae bacterium]